MSVSLSSKKDKMARITKSEDLVELYENIHHLLWTREGFSPEKAMDHLNLFLYLMCIEPQIESGNIHLSKVCKFSELAKIEEEGKLFDVVKKQVQAEIIKNPVTKDYFTRIEIQYPETVFNLVKHLNRIDMTIDDKDFLGSIYEYIIGRGMTTMSDDGQYFTERQICKCAMELGSVKLADDGTVDTMIDPFCGTGGFINEYVKTVQRGIEDKYAFWKNNTRNVYGNDIKVSSVMSTLLNLIFVTGTSFSKENIIHKNSFYEPLFSETEKKKKFRYIFTNPPFGGDKSKGDDFKFKYGEYEKGKTKKPENYVFKVSDDIRSIGIQIDDKVAAAVQLCMALLEEGGTCGLVLPEGFFFQSGKQLIELRKKLVEEYNVKYVVDIPQGVFENTPTKTCLMIFGKDGKTSEVEFIDFGKWTKQEERALIKVPVAELKEKGYSLNYKRYVKQEWNLPQEYSIYNLGDVIEVQLGKRIIKRTSLKGIIPVYGGGDISFHTSTKNREGVNCKISKEGMSLHNCVMIINGPFYMNSQGMTIVSSDDTLYNTQYLWYWLVNNKQTIYDCGRGTAQKAIDMTQFNEIKIPLPPIEKQREIVEQIDTYAVRANKLKDIVKDIERGLVLTVKQLYQSHECRMMELKELCKFLAKSKRVASSGKDKGKFNFYTCSEKVRKYDECDYKEEAIIIGTGGTPVIHIDNHFSCSTDNIIIQSDNNIISNGFLFYLIKGNMKIIEDGFSGSTIAHVTKRHIEEIQVPVPPLDAQITINDEYMFLFELKKRIAKYETIAAELISKLK